MLTCCLAITTLAALTGCHDGDSSTASKTNRTAGVRCTDEGIAIDGDEMTASADGVHLPVTNTTEGDARLVAGPVSENPTHTIPPGTSTIVLLAPPGELRLSCGPHNEVPKNRAVTVTVKDPRGFYRSVNLADALGCEPDESVDGDPPGWGSTAREAAEAFAAQLDAGARIIEGNGYRDHVRQEFVLYVNGVGYGTLDAYPQPGDRYRASFGVICSTRTTGYKPGTVGGDG